MEVDHRPFLSDYPLSFSGISGVAFLQENSTLLAKWRGSYAFLWLEDGRRVSIGKYISSSVIPDVITRIKAEIYPELEARFRKSLSIGQTVQFGSILINISGLTMHNHSIPWNDVKRLSIDHGRLQLETIPNKTMRIDVLKIPNVEILLLLIREMEQL